MGGDTYLPYTVFGILLNNKQIKEWSKELAIEFKDDMVNMYDHETDEPTPTMILRAASFSKDEICIHVLFEEAYSRWEGESFSTIDSWYDVRCVVGIKVEDGAAISDLAAREQEIAANIAKNTPIKGGDLRLYTGIIS